MLELLLLVGAVLVLRRSLQLFKPASTAPATAAAPPKPASKQVAQMSAYADRIYAEKKWLAAEKAYLNVLKLDHNNVTAYSHLGIIYSTQKNMPDAIECFQIAMRLKPSGPTFQNLALAYYDHRQYAKSVVTYQKAIQLEPTPQRYVGLSKAYRKQKDLNAAIAALEKAAAIEPTSRMLEMLAATYEEAGRTSEAAATMRRLHPGTTLEAGAVVKFR